MYNTLYHQTKHTSMLLWLHSASLTSLCPLTAQFLEAFSMAPLPRFLPFTTSSQTQQQMLTIFVIRLQGKYIHYGCCHMGYCRASDSFSGEQSKYPSSVVTRRKKRVIPKRHECQFPWELHFLIVKAWKYNSCLICQSCKLVNENLSFRGKPTTSVLKKK